jgi:hypothetical protein
MTQNTLPRIFKIGTTTIVEDESLAGKPLEEIKDILKRTYPEVAHATVRETTLEDGTVVMHFIPQAGKKG